MSQANIHKTTKLTVFLLFFVKKSLQMSVCLVQLYYNVKIFLLALAMFTLLIKINDYLNYIRKEVQKL